MIISGCYFTPYSIKAISAGGWGGGLCPAPYQQRAYSKHRARLTGGTVPGSSVLYLLGVGARTILYYVDNIYTFPISSDDPNYLHTPHYFFRIRRNDRSTAGILPPRPFPGFPHRDTGTCTRPRLTIGVTVRAGAGPDTIRCRRLMLTVPGRATSGMRR